MEKIYTCEFCDFTTKNRNSLANHVRWSHKYTKDSSIRKEFSEKIISIAREKNPLITKTCICKKCGKEFVQTLKSLEWERHKEKEFCSRSCANSHEQGLEVRKKRQQTIAKTRNLDINNFKTNRVCPVCGKEFFGKTRTCSKKCNGQFQHFKALEKKPSTLYEYQNRCKFHFSLKSYPNEFDFSLIEKYGWYAPTNSKKPNLEGVSRDHIVSVKYGWENNIDPKIISHPANCRLLRHSDNSSKGSKCSMTYQELLEKIKDWDLKYN